MKGRGIQGIGQGIIVEGMKGRGIQGIGQGIITEGEDPQGVGVGVMVEEGDLIRVYYLNLMEINLKKEVFVIFKLIF